MVNKQNTDKKLISKEEKSRDGSIVLISIVIALILAIGAGLLVYLKNEARKKRHEPAQNSYLHLQGTKPGPIVLDGNHIEPATTKL
jgi:flagellar basal body-associated protein FliL